MAKLTFLALTVAESSHTIGLRGNDHTIKQLKGNGTISALAKKWGIVSGE